MSDTAIFAVQHLQDCMHPVQALCHAGAAQAGIVVGLTLQ